MGGFNLKEAFPDLNPRFHHFRLDPLDAGRVWFTSQASGTDKGSGFLGNRAGLLPPWLLGQRRRSLGRKQL